MGYQCKCLERLNIFHMMLFFKRLVVTGPDETPIESSKGSRPLSRKKQSGAQLFSCFGESKVSPFFQWHLGTKTPRWERLEFDCGYVRDHDSHLGMCLGHLLTKYGCSSAYSFPVILIQLGRGHFRQNFTEIQILKIMFFRHFRPF